jgi:hypothetical protein
MAASHSAIVTLAADLRWLTTVRTGVTWRADGGDAFGEGPGLWLHSAQSADAFPGQARRCEILDGRRGAGRV